MIASRIKGHTVRSGPDATLVEPSRPIAGVIGAKRQAEVSRRTAASREIIRFLLGRLDADAAIRPPAHKSPPPKLA
jgi:hypothetical protein